MSEFAQALSKLIDEAKVFDRNEWASVLMVSVEQIDSWLQEESLPTSMKLNFIYTTVDSLGATPELIESVRQTFAKPAKEVSGKNGRRLLPTVWDYMKRPIFSEISNKLAKLTPQEQEEFLDKIYG